MKILFLIIIVLFGLIQNTLSQERNKHYLFSENISLLEESQKRCVMFSFIGEYKQAMNGYNDDYSCKKNSYKITKKDSINFSNKDTINAYKYIIDKSSNEQIILINEAHNMPMNRAFTLTLLQALYNNGYRYFGAEDFKNSAKDLPLSKSDNGYYPNYKTGYYIKDPVFGDLVREALRIGYTVFAYEDTCKNSIHWVNDSVYRVDLSTRDFNMAVNINAILKKDSTAKILIHAGFGHIIEEKNSMGGELKRLTGINPLSINQSTMTEMQSKDCEDPYYKLAKIKKPTIFINKNKDSVFVDDYFRNKKDTDNMNLLDIEVFHPRTAYINGRPDWLYMNGRRKAIIINKKYLTIGYPVLVFAYYYNEDIEEAIPIDVIEIKSKNDIKPLILPQGNFNIIIQNKQKKINTYQIKNGKQKN
ncbi:MAG: hypothetical protein WCK02_16865 [Bacteroidota bacterium]